MKLGTRLILYLLIPLIALMTLFGYLEQRRSRAALREETAREGRVLTRTIQIAVQDAVRDRQIEDVHALVDRISGSGPVLGVRLFDPSGNLDYQSASLRTEPFTQSDALRRALHAEEPVESHERVGARPVISFVAPLLGAGGSVLGAIQVLQHESFIETEGRAAQRAIALLTAVTILATGAIVLIVMRYSLGRPVEDLVRSFRDVSSAEVFTPMTIRRHDELGRLAEEFNSMCRRLQTTQRNLVEEQEERGRMEARLRRAEHRAGLGRLAAGLAHEIGTPLNVIAGRAESIRRHLAGQAEAERGLKIIAAQIDRITRVVRGMLDFAREPEPRVEATDVASVVTKVIEFLEPRFEEAGIRAEAFDPRAVASLPAVLADADQLYQVFLNVAMNAADAMPGGGRLRLDADRVHRSHPEHGGAPREFLAVALEDTGTGIAPRDLERVFEPFFTTKEVGKGTGLGMSICYGIVREHGGWIEVQSELKHGTRVSVFLPVPVATGGEVRLAG
jgi:two-component system, NtrC family, sensor kinase